MRFKLRSLLFGVFLSAIVACWYARKPTIVFDAASLDIDAEIGKRCIAQVQIRNSGWQELIVEPMSGPACGQLEVKKKLAMGQVQTLNLEFCIHSFTKPIPREAFPLNYTFRTNDPLHPVVQFVAKVRIVDREPKAR